VYIASNVVVIGTGFVTPLDIGTGEAVDVGVDVGVELGLEVGVGLPWLAPPLLYG
jgi:hypothetical protein